jgi:hypothetical protein
MPVNRVLLLVMILLVAAACGGVERREVAGGYCLEQWPSGFNLKGCSSGAILKGSTDNGPLEGLVVRIGWDAQVIVAQRAHLAGGTLGWMILDTTQQKLSGPLTDDAFEQERARSTRLRQIKIYAVAEAWERLN